MGVLDSDKVDKIKRLLKWHPRGMTISDLASGMGMNRNLVAKYLDMLLISGQVEMQLTGAAKVYFLAQKVPVSAILEFSSDMVIVTDSEQRILQANEQVFSLLDMARDAIMQKRLTEIGHPFMIAIGKMLGEGKQGASTSNAIDVSCTIRDDERHFRIKKVQTAFEDGSNGFTFIAEDITPRKKYEDMLRLSEARYRGLVQSSGEAIIGFDADGTIISWNPAAERLYGYSEPEVLAHPFHMLSQGSTSEEIDGLIARIMGGETIRRYETKMARKGGAALDVLVTISPISGENGAIAGASLIVQDITGEKMEQYLRKHEDQYRSLVEDLNVGIYRSTGDPKGKFVWGNTALLNILGYQTMSALREIPVVDVFDQPDGRVELLNELRTRHFVKNRILNLKKPDGAPVRVSVTALAEFDANNNIVFINGIVQDLSQLADLLAAGQGPHS